MPEDGFAAWKWMPVIALFGEERITQKLNRGFGNADTKNNESSEDDEVEIEPEDIDWEGLNFVWDDETLGVDLLNAVIRRETRENMLAAMTDKQREVFILYHKYGWTQQRIADAIGVSALRFSAPVPPVLNVAVKRDSPPRPLCIASYQEKAVYRNILINKYAQTVHSIRI